jgi:hypothetical protein
MAAYQYQELTHDDTHDTQDQSPGKSIEIIRILTLEPGTANDAVNCQLHAEQLAEVANNATYESLSYCWGSEDTIMTINVRDDRPEKAEFPVRPNLHAALCAFRLKDRPRRLWIDAICINQKDNAERNNQIPLMRRIYEGAIGTLIWLGEGTADSKAAINLVHSLKTAASKSGHVIPKIGMFNNNDLAKHGLPPIFSSDYIKLLTMLEQPYFSRAWIVQEVAVSKKARLYWGAESVDWEDLVRGIDFSLRAELPFALHPAVNRLIPIADEAARYQDGSCKLLSVLLRHRPCQATVPIDKVYAFWGLTENNEESFIPLDIRYGQHLVTAYTDVASRILEHDRSLDALSLPPTPFESQISELPSWVPDWNISSGVTLRQTFNAETNSLANVEEAGGRVSSPFCAAGTTTFSPRENLSSTILIVEGHKFDTITSVGAAYEGLHMPSSITEVGQSAVSLFHTRNVFMQWEDSVGLPSSNELTKMYINGEALVDAFFQTLMIGNLSLTDNKQSLREEYLTWSKSQRPAPILNSLKLGFLQTPISAVRTLTSSVMMRDTPTGFQKRIRHVIFRKFIRTERGYMGLAAGKVQLGDQIWLLKGSKVPIVLRANETGDGWKVVGDSYVHGIMFGEGFEMEKCESIALY